MSSSPVENEKNLQSDAWRLFQLEKASARPGHDWQKFGTGNKKTLETEPEAKGIKVHQALLDFHAKHYSANIMGLSVLGKVTVVVDFDIIGVFDGVVGQPEHHHPRQGGGCFCRRRNKFRRRL